MESLLNLMSVFWPLMLFLWAYMLMDVARYHFLKHNVRNEIRMISFFYPLATPIWAIQWSKLKFVGMLLLAAVPYVNVLMTVYVLLVLAGHLVRVLYFRD